MKKKVIFNLLYFSDHLNNINNEKNIKINEYH